MTDNLTENIAETIHQEQVTVNNLIELIQKVYYIYQKYINYERDETCEDLQVLIKNEMAKDIWNLGISSLKLL